jgi:hypothetical protein
LKETQRRSERKGLPLPAEVGFILLPVTAVIIWFYFWTAASSGRYPVSDSAGYYPSLARGLLHHRLNLDLEPRPEILELADPYDPLLNKDYRLHDASLYRGKYYLYFGLTPAACLFLPYLWLTHFDFPQKMAVPLFCSAGFFFAALLFLLIVWSSLPATPVWLRLGCLLSLGLANLCPFLLRRPDVYEVAIGCAFGFLQLGFLLFYLGMRSRERSLRWFILASICLAATVGARPSYGLAVGVFFVFMIVLAWKKTSVHGSSASRGSIGDCTWKRWLVSVPWGRPVSPRLVGFFGMVVWATLPILVIGLTIGWYNAARFGDPLEFGQRYQLAGVEMGKLQFFQLDNMPYDFWYDFFAPLSYCANFPFVDAGQPAFTFGHTYGLEKVAGMFFVSPVTIWALRVAVLYQPKKRANLDSPVLVTVLFMAASVGAIVLPLIFVSGATMRYLVDFVPTFVLLGCIMVCQWNCLNQNRRCHGRILGGLVVILLLIGVLNGFFLSFSGYHNSFELGNPGGYAALARFFQPLESFLRLIGAQ